MNRKVRNILAGFLAACAFAATAPAGCFLSYAASARIAFSDPAVTMGQEFNVTVKITSQDGNLGASDVVLSYDPQFIRFVGGDNAHGGAGSIRLVGTMNSSSTREFSHTLQFEALQAGNTAITVSSSEVYDADTQTVDVTSGSSSVKISAPSAYSSEAGLSSLKISPGQLSPPFSPDVTAYSVNVGGDVTKLAVSADAKDNKARVLVNGDSGLREGANTVVCRVTAEDGQTTRAYTITVNKSAAGETVAEAPAETEGEEAPPAQLGEQTVEMKGVTYQVAAAFDPSLLPEGYTQSSCTYNGMEVMCGSGNGINLLYFQAADGNGLFFIVSESGAVSPYVTIDVGAKSLLVLPPDETLEIPDGFAATPIDLPDGSEVQGWVWQSDPEKKYCVVYGMNENGERGLYRFDRAEKTFQRYFQDPAIQSRYDDSAVEALQEQYNSLCRDYNIRFIIIIALIAACLILFFIIVSMLLRQKSHAEKGFSNREEAPTPVKRRAMEEEQRRRQAKISSYAATDGRGGGSQNGGRTETGRQDSRGNAASSGRPEYWGSAASSIPQGRNGYREGSGSAGRGIRNGGVSAGSPEYRNMGGSAARPVYRDSSAVSGGSVYRGGSMPPGRSVNADRGVSPVRREYRESTVPSEGAGYRDGAPSVGRRPEGPYTAAKRRSPVRGQDFGGTAAGSRGYSRQDDRAFQARNIPAADRTGEMRGEILHRRTPQRQETEGAKRRKNASCGEPGRRDAGMEEVIRQREREREERGRRTKERLEQMRMEDKRARAARMETAAGVSRIMDDGDFEILN